MDKLIYEIDEYKIYKTPHHHIYLRDRSPESAVVLAFFEGKIVVCKQFREGVADYTYELPGGGVEPGENIEVAALRELREESGHVADKIDYLGEICPNPGLTNHVSHLYYAGETSLADGQQLDDDEDIQVEYYTLEEVNKKLSNSSWKNSEMVHALFLATAKGLI